MGRQQTAVPRIAQAAAAPVVAAAEIAETLVRGAGLSSQAEPPAEPSSAGLAPVASLVPAGAEADAMPLRIVPPIRRCLCPMLPAIRLWYRKIWRVRSIL